MFFLPAFLNGQENVKVSVLSLLRPESIKIDSPENLDFRLVLNSGSTEILFLPATASAFAEVTSEGVLLSLMGEKRLCSHIGIKGADLETRLELTLLAPNPFRRVYAGELDIWSDNGMLCLVLSLPLESLVAQVTAAEMDIIPGAMEALKAQSICVRSYILAEKGRHTGGIDFCDNTHCFLFRGLDGVFGSNSNLTIVIEATAATKGMLLKFRGQTIAGYYHACCGGETTLPSIAWGAGGNDEGYTCVRCDFCGDSRYYRWNNLVSPEEWARAFPESQLDSLEFKSGEKGVVLNIAGQSKHYSWEDFRRILASQTGWSRIPSFPFNIEKGKRGLLISGRGHGHKTGLCQAGAIAQAKAGKSCYQILKYYFPDCRVSN